MDRPAYPGRSRVALPVRRGLGSTLLLLCLLFVASCGGVSASAAPPPSGALVVSFIDVGQGDATLIQSGGESYLVDGGDPEAGPEVVDFLRSRGVEELNGMVATHPDADHIGGLPYVLDAFEVSTAYLSGDTKGTTTSNTFLRAVRDEEAKVFEARAGLRLDWGGVDATVVAPPPEELFSDSNENSVSVLLTYGEARILLAGDAEEGEEEYMANGPYTGPLTVLKINHHGSNSSSTPVFLSRFPPKIAVIQVGENSYGHPTPETLERLREYGAKVFRNDEDGNVIVTIKDQQVDVAVTNP